MHILTSVSRSKHSTVAVIGLGKIGLPLAVQYASHGRHVIGCDINSTVVEMVNAGQCHIQGEPGLDAGLSMVIKAGLLSTTSQTSEAIQQASVVVVVVPVIVDEQHNVDFSSIDAATIDIGLGLQPGTLVIFETTLPVGTTAQRLARILEETSNLQAGQDFSLAYSPERVSSGSILRDLHIYPKIIGGIDTKSLEAAVSFYQSVLDASIMTMASTEEAEFVKLIETTYRDVNIALANEYARYADMHGLNIYTSIAAANTQPYSHIHTPGVGVGGHCIPVYPYFLLANANLPAQTEEIQISHTTIPSSQYHQTTLMLPHIARRINDSMAAYAVERIEALIGSLTGRSVLILGVAYRGNVRETAFTSALLLKNALLEHGATVYVDDPLFSQDELRAAGYMPLPAELEDEICAIILQTAHQAYTTFNSVLADGRFGRCKVVLDGRNVLRREQIEALGMYYIAIGDGYQQKVQAESYTNPTALYEGV